jgi:N-acylglucosamine 2-epimerase
MVDAGSIDACVQRLDRELYQHVLPFWTTYSNDAERGGFFACLDENGEVYDRRKFMWLNGRQIYMFARICDRWSSEELKILSAGKLDRAEMIDMATKAAMFMTKHGIREDGLVYFSLAETGEPYHFERKIFGACFLCLGCGVLSKVTGSKELKIISQQLLATVIGLSRDPAPLGRPVLPGAPATSPLNIPMITLNLLDELRHAGTIEEDVDGLNFEEIERRCVNEIVKHVRLDQKVVLENVKMDGSVLPGYDGRHMNPGHAIEAGWFVFQYALRNGNLELQQLAINMIEWSFESGWDKEQGGLYYFLDSEGRSPPYLEWNMKLWWPHCEALVAYAVLYRHTKQTKFWDRFQLVLDYTLSHFSDSAGHGEWFGYLDREGRVTHKFKGGPYKGCFHVPRALYLASEQLRGIV